MFRLEGNTKPQAWQMKQKDSSFTKPAITNKNGDVVTGDYVFKDFFTRLYKST